MKIDAIDVWDSIIVIGLVVLFVLVAIAGGLVANALILVLMALVMKGIILLSFPWLGSILPIQLFVVIAAFVAFLRTPRYGPEQPPESRYIIADKLLNGLLMLGSVWLIGLVV